MEDFYQKELHFQAFKRFQNDSGQMPIVDRLSTNQKQEKMRTTLRWLSFLTLIFDQIVAIKV